MIWSTSARNEQQKKLLEWAVPHAVKIASTEGSVSPRGLVEQLNLTKSDAKLVLDEAQRLGLMYQAISGRCILYPEQARQILVHGVPNVALPETPFDATPSDMGARSGLKGLAIVSFLMLLGLLAWFFTTYRAPDDADAPRETQLQMTPDAPLLRRPEPAAAPELDTRSAATVEPIAKLQNKERRRGDAPAAPRAHP